MATQADLTGRQVLEVGCGHGGGASYLTRTLHPASYTGLDLNRAAIAFCRKRHKLASLDFVHGNAEKLPFPDQSFDAVINLESSAAYPHFSRFLAEVVRVLRPGGHFLYADLRPRDSVAEWEAALANAPLRMLSQQVINAQVLRGLDKNRHRTLDLVSRLPSGLQGIGREYSGTEGTGVLSCDRTREVSVPDVLLHERCRRRIALGERRPTERRAGCGTRGRVLASQKAGIPLTSNINVVIPSLFGSSQTFRSLRSDLEHAFRSLLARRDEATHQR